MNKHTPFFPCTLCSDACNHSTVARAVKQGCRCRRPDVLCTWWSGERLCTAILASGEETSHPHALHLSSVVCRSVFDACKVPLDSEKHRRPNKRLRRPGLVSASSAPAGKASVPGRGELLTLHRARFHARSRPLVLEKGRRVWGRLLNRRFRRHPEPRAALPRWLVQAEAG